VAVGGEGTGPMVILDEVVGWDLGRQLPGDLTFLGFLLYKF